MIPNNSNNRPFRSRRPVKNDGPRINDELPYRDNDTVRVNYNSRTSNEGFSEVVTMCEAKELSRSMELDLIEIAPQAVPPVLRLDNYDKYQWEQKKNNKKKKTVSSLKEVQLSVNISEHDLEIKATKAKKFIADGDKVKVVLRMCGRELGRREQSQESFRSFIELMSDVATIDGQIRNEPRCTIAILRKR